MTIDGALDGNEIVGMIDDSYDLVVGSLTRAQRQELATSERLGRPTTSGSASDLAP